MALTLHLSQFDGPLDMLLFLIGKAKVDIKDIFVSEVTDQYIQSVQNAPDLDMDDASAFINMAATLIEIKSRSLLPKVRVEEGEEDPEQALIRQLEEYQRVKQMVEDMQGFEQAAAQMFAKLPEEYPLPPPSFELTGLTLSGLIKAFARVMERAKVNEEEEEGNHYAPRPIIRDEYDIPGCMKHIARKLKKGCVRFTELFSDHPTRDEVVTLFLALLEMIRLGKAEVVQDQVYEEIVLSPRNRVEDDTVPEGEK
ncbi:MAG: segregation/condensation protein A [Clostridia bacterium]|nr:segregation/condensation protein A [Clostridia bacterium]